MSAADTFEQQQIKTVAHLRDLLYKYQLHLEDPEHVEWTAEDEALYKQLLAEISAYYPHSYAPEELAKIEPVDIDLVKIGKAIRQLSKFIRERQATNILPPDVVANYNRYQVFLKKEAELVCQKNSSLATARIKLLARLASAYPALNKEDCEEIANTSIVSFARTGADSLAVTANNIVQTVTSYNLPISPADASAVLTPFVQSLTLDPAIAAAIATISIAAELPADSFVTTYTVSSIFANGHFSPPPDSSILRGTITQAQSAQQVERVITQLQTNSSKLQRISQTVVESRQFVRQLREAELSLRKELGLTGLTGEDLNTAVKAIVSPHFWIPVIALDSEMSKKAAPEQRSKFREFAKSVGLNYVSKIITLPPHVYAVLAKSQLTAILDNPYLASLIEKAKTDDELLQIMLLVLPQDIAETQTQPKEEVVQEEEANALPQIVVQRKTRLEKFNEVVSLVKRIKETSEKIVNFLESPSLAGLTTGELVGALGLGAFLGAAIATATSLFVLSVATVTTGVANELGILDAAASHAGIQWNQALLNKIPYGFQGLAKTVAFFGKQTLASWTGKLATAFKTFNFSGQFGAIVGAAGTAAVASLASLMIMVAVVMLSLPIVVALILFIINTSAFVVPPGSSYNPLFSGSGDLISCSPPQAPLSFTNSASGPIARRAWQIVNNLERGFWCYWNKSPDYPALFDQAKFRTNPNPNPKEGTNLFWCTWLVVKSYNESGNQIPIKLLSNEMMDWFKSTNRFVSVSEAIESKNVPQGSVVFVYTGSDSRPVQHVAILWSASLDVFQTIDSNAGLKTFTYSISTSKDKACWGSGCKMRIVGFGKP